MASGKTAGKRATKALPSRGQKATAALPRPDGDGGGTGGKSSRFSPKSTVKSHKVRPRVDLYAVISCAVEEGARFGWRRAHKYTNVPSDDAAVEQIQREVMLALEQVIRFSP